MKIRKPLAAVLAVALFATAACGSDDAPSASNTPAASAPSAPASAPSSTAPAAGETTGGATGSPDSPTLAPESTSPPVTASGPLNFYTDKAAWEPDFVAMNEASKAANGLELAFTGYADPTAYDAFIKQAFRTDKKPTLFTWHTGDQLGDLVKEGLVAETTDLWTKATENGDVPAGLIDNYTFEGKQYCVPLLGAYWTMYYNKKIFADNNLTPPKTWEELMTIADTLKSKNITPFHQMNFIFEFVWFQAILAGTDPAAYQGLGTGATKYTDPVVVDAMKKWGEMMKKGYFIDPGVSTDPQTLLKTGEVAMAYFGTFFTGQLTAIDQVSGKDYGAFPVPNVNASLPKQQMIMETGPLCAAAGDPNEAAALAYSAWWMGQDAQQTWADKRGDISFNPKVTVKDPVLAELAAAIKDFEIQKRWLEATPNPIYKVASEQFGAWVTNPSDDPMPTLEAIQAEADAFWAGG